MEKNLQNEAAIKKLKDLAEGIRVCMYCTMQHDSDMASRPLATAGVDEDGTIWFFTSDDTSAARETSGGAMVCLNYSDPTKNSYMCVMGNADLVKDKAKMGEMWSDIMKTWFPQGLDTPGIALLKVSPTSAHYWESDIARMKILFSYLKAKITGEAANGTEGTEGKLEI